ncbi:hypothetical protein [Emticicia sp. BO119]|uniref:hypothetical protein n=1 Tax=Emticicia sp. BO119 TaxID=2757768 RepID=UPI0015F08187|nr:hypothetical protein [Emticicia sp. BO119]MBA4848987.1 hypothetical protein [Emticicia sp. BO119]
MSFIIKSNVKNETNWSGKEFSNLPAKIYGSLQSATDALEGYWFSEHVPYKTDKRRVIIVPLTDYMQKKLLEQKKIRW